MEITADFLLKHIRPYGMDAWNELCHDGSSFSTYLDTLGVSPQEKGAAFNEWAKTAMTAVNADTLQFFAQSAEAVSQARWDELYPTGKSTIMFFNFPLLQQLSLYASNNAGADFDFDPYEHIPIAVTIQRHSHTVEINQQVSGALLTSDASGNCVHFRGLIT